MHILVVDPEAEIRLVFFVAAAQVDAEIDFAETGQEALAMLLDHSNYDAVFAADQLGDLTTRELARGLRERACYAYQPLILLSQSDEATHLVELLTYGDDVIVKPFSQQVLLAKILAHQRIHSLYKALHEQHQQLALFRKRTESEHMIAGDVFQQLVARSNLALKGLERFVSPYSMFNGDLLLTAQGPAGQLYFLVADVTGHGLSAALGTLPIAETFLALAAQGPPVGEMARAMNRLYLERIPPYILCAATIGVFEPERSLVRCWTGGIPPMLIVNAQRQLTAIRPPMHMALGACDEGLFESFEDSFVLMPGDQLIVFTDGVIEASNSAGELFGMNRLQQALCSPGTGSLIGQVTAALTQHTGNRDGQDDDVTLLCLDHDRCQAALRKTQVKPRQEIDHEAPDWQHTLTLSPVQLRNTNLCEMVLSYLPMLYICSETRLLISRILDEMLANALDHGLLGLDTRLKQTADLSVYLDKRKQALNTLTEGWIKVSISAHHKQNAATITLQCQDSGKGLTAAHLADCLAAPANPHSTIGRGLYLITKLCDAFDYDPQLNQFTARLVISAV